MKHIATIFLLACIASSYLWADDPPVDSREAELERLAQRAPKQHLKELLDYNLEKLDAIYEKSVESAEDEDHRKALEASQKAWLKFFATDGVVAGWNAKGGSLAYSASVQQKIHQVRIRIYQLSTPFLQGWQDVPRVPPIVEQ